MLLFAGSTPLLTPTDFTFAAFCWYFLGFCCCCWLTTVVTSLPDQQTVLVQVMLLLLLTYNSGDKPTWSADCSGSGYVVVVVDLQQRWQAYLISRLFWFRRCHTATHWLHLQTQQDLKFEPVNSQPPSSSSSINTHKKGDRRVSSTVALNMERGMGNQ